MKKRILSVVLLLVCISMLTGCCFHSEWYAATCEAPKTCVECGETEGEALGHTWVDATCVAPKTCSTCRLTEGEALGHIWEEATTEAPKTCVTCAATEGERIITDSRFTTAATKDLHGSWVGELIIPGSMMDIDGFDYDLILAIRMVLGNDGTMSMGCSFANMDDFISALTTYLAEVMYDTLASEYPDRDEADAAFADVYGMTVTEYASSLVAEQDFAGTLEAGFSALNFTGVYYVENNQLYTGTSWDLEMGGSEFVVNGDRFILSESVEGLGNTAITFTRVTE